MFNLIPKALAVGTLTTAQTTDIVQNGVNEILANLTTNFQTIFVASIVIGVFFGGAYALMRVFRSTTK